MKKSPEADYRAKIDQYFKLYFNIEREVWSIEGKRIDYILQCKKTGYLFGVEVKHTEHMKGIDIGNYIKQASGYSSMKWKTSFSDMPVIVPIFITPAISNTIKQIIPESKTVIAPRYCDGKPYNDQFGEYYQSFHDEDHTHSNVNSMLSAFGIGEIKKKHYNVWDATGDVKAVPYFIFLYANKIIWQSTSSGLHKNNYDSYWKHTSI
jgi:hypothetical protein